MAEEEEEAAADGVHSAWALAASFFAASNRRRLRLSHRPTVTTGAPTRTSVPSAPAVSSAGRRPSRNAVAEALGDRHARRQHQCNPGVMRRCSQRCVSRFVMAKRVVVPTARTLMSCHIPGRRAGASSSSTSRDFRIARMLPNSSSLGHASPGLLAARRPASLVRRVVYKGRLRRTGRSPQSSTSPRWPQPWLPSASLMCRALPTRPISSETCRTRAFQRPRRRLQSGAWCSQLRNYPV